MSHMVTFQTEDGKVSYRLAEGLDEAVRLIEDLRNREAATDTHLYAVEEVPIEFHAYYRVEVGAVNRAAADFVAAELDPAEALAVDVVDSIQDVQAVEIEQSVLQENAHDAVETPTFGIFSRP